MKLPTNALMESFEKYCKAIRKIKPNFIRFKDGNLIKHGLKHISLFQMEMLFLWFLKEKKHMRPTIGAALSKGIINDFINASRREYGFYAKLEKLAKQYIATAQSADQIKNEASKMVKRLEELKTGFSKKIKPFTPKERAQIAEEVAKLERKNG